MTREAAMFVDQMAESIFPMAPRPAGGAFDALVSNPDVNDYPLEAITVPTLLLHAQDDPLTSYAAVERAAGQIPGPRFVSLGSDGHLLLGQDDVVGQGLSAFLAEPITTSGPGGNRFDDGDHRQPEPGILGTEPRPGRRPRSIPSVSVRSAPTR